ncbi:hypothetical protein DO97_17415 [Neosynechococcus sphagnicola sy1]|uniref:PAS domain-containing protein n=1 Tax=Neosynechococcus sphagnicola sy1 TaxID=1497020 RepID=A0A098TL99_9CYAN|nr:PAS domain S-box protein [Neosynechococcus sphagnicola]KGF71613.1 hypothetical protein DO97_17415 [Neosynechococcus sphagnicola sy1]
MHQPPSASEEELRAFFNVASEAVLLVNDAGECLDANLAACVLFHLTPETLRGYALSDLLHPHLIHPADHVWQVPWVGEFEFQLPDQAAHQILVQSLPQVQPHRHLLVFQEITAQKPPAVEANPLASESKQHLQPYSSSPEDLSQYHRLLFEQNPNPMWIYDLETLAFLAVNQAAVTLYGYSQAEFLSMTIADIRPPQEIPKLLASIQNQSPQFSQSSGVWLHRQKDGALLDVRITSQPMQWLGRAARVVIAQDVTEHQRIETVSSNRGRYLSALVEIQQQLLSVHGRDSFYQQVLASLGQAALASRTYLFENHWNQAGELLTSQRAEWCAEGIQPELHNPLYQNLSYALVPRWLATFFAG